MAEACTQEFSKYSIDSYCAVISNDHLFEESPQNLPHSIYSLLIRKVTFFQKQGKKYYDALKSVNNLVKDARKVQQTILMVGDITDTYVTSFQKMMRDDNFTVEELGAIAFGYTKLLEESNDVLTELKNVVNITTLSMTDKERMDVVERCYSKMKRYRNLVSYYTNKNISVSYLRAKKKNDLDRIMGLYGNMNERYW